MRRIIVTGAGGGGSNNLIRSIRKSGYNVYIIGTNMDKFLLIKSLADKNYVLPPGTDIKYIPALNKLIDIEKVELVVPNSDTEVRVISENREKLKCRVFLPKKETVRLCQDKYKMIRYLSKKGVDVPETLEIKSLDDVDEVCERLMSKSNSNCLWCRLRDSSGSMASLPVKDAEQAKFWIKYWRDMRGVSERRFIISEYLPGRDYAFQSIWKDGEIVIGKTCERISYIFERQMPSGQSSTPKIARLVYNEDVVETCVKAVKAIDNEATGNFCIDLKEDAEGVPHITEINIGRFFMITNIFNLSGKYNMAEIYLKLAFDEPVRIEERLKFRDIDENVYLIRGLDTLPDVVNINVLEKKINYIEI